ncbi:unannotated protein [freshwater metagenome]|uniref:Unannotated protein n=1 Tax=freshwater metagenome TaxID=449393 RepID=A0A6J6UV38_9ZZZZ
MLTLELYVGTKAEIFVINFSIFSVFILLAECISLRILKPRIITISSFFENLLGLSNTCGSITVTIPLSKTISINS